MNMDMFSDGTRISIRCFLWFILRGVYFLLILLPAHVILQDSSDVSAWTYGLSLGNRYNTWPNSGLLFVHRILPASDLGSNR